MIEPMASVYDALNWPDRLRPPVVLPDVPGCYRDYQNGIWRLNTFGYWDCIGSPTCNEHVAQCAPFTRLRPEAEVAAEVLAEVAAEFGVGFLSGFKAMSARWAAK